MSFSTPVAFFIFNRPAVTRRVLQAIRCVRPSTLLVVCDGPRRDRPGEDAAVMQTRAVLNEIDWPCDVMTDFSDLNLGCKRRVSSGLDWVFERFNEAIILEDDCVPDASFFGFCQDMLASYRDNELVFSVSGSNFQGGCSRSNHGYYFSKYFHCWGWATWRHAWQTVDLEMNLWRDFVKAGGLHEVSDSQKEELFWESTLGAQERGEIDSWAYSCLASSWMSRKLNIIPDVNLVRNIGFDAQATHMKSAPPWIPAIAEELSEWKAPNFIVRSKLADMYTFEQVYARPPRLKRLRNKIRRQWNRLATRNVA